MREQAAEGPSAAAAEAGDHAHFPTDIAVDFRRPFVPEHRTQLYYTPLYRSLHFEHRLRYNQLFALRLNEYAMMLEEGLTDRVMKRVVSRIGPARHPDIVDAVGRLRAEEAHHRQMFGGINRSIRPDLYPIGRDRFFSVLPLWARGAFPAAGVLSRWFSFVLWYAIAMEEASVALAREMAGDKETETLGPLDPAFASIYAAHAKDEARHVRLEQRLIDLALIGDRPRRRKWDAILFRQMLIGLCTPTRGGSGVRVIRQLVRDMPELQNREDEMIQAVLDLGRHREFQISLFNREMMPVAFAIYDRIPELANLGERMPGYVRQSA